MGLLLIPRTTVFAPQLRHHLQQFGEFHFRLSIAHEWLLQGKREFELFSRGPAC
jgi:hypothetical protein